MIGTKIVIKEIKRKYIFNPLDTKLVFRKGSKIIKGNNSAVFNDRSNRIPSKIECRYVLRGMVFEKFSPMKISLIMELIMRRYPSKTPNNLNEFLSI